MKNLHVALIFIAIAWFLMGLVVGISKKKNILLSVLTGPFSLMLASKGNGSPARKMIPNNNYPIISDVRNA